MDVVVYSNPINLNHRTRTYDSEVKELFQEKAIELFHELENNKLTVRRTDKKEYLNNRFMRVVENRNPQWYSELYHQYGFTHNRKFRTKYSTIRRDLVFASLGRIINGTDIQPSPTRNSICLDVILRTLIHSMLTNEQFFEESRVRVPIQLVESAEPDFDKIPF